MPIDDTPRPLIRSAILAKPSETGTGCGCLLVVALVVVGIVAQLSPATWVVLGVLCAAVIVLVVRYSAAQARERRESLEARFGAEVAQRILAKQYWQGATVEMLVESLGQPLDVKERVLKSKTKHTYCYQQTAKNRYALKIHLEDGIVVGWDDETRSS